MDDQDDDSFDESIWWDEFVNDDWKMDDLFPMSSPSPKPRAFYSKLPNINRDFEAGHQRLYRDYFAENPVYGPDFFRRRFRMTRCLFNKIAGKLAETDRFFVKKRDATGKFGASTIQKVTAAVRMLAYGCSSDSLDEIVRMSETLIWDCTIKFCLGVIKNFKSQYLRYPTEDDVRRVVEANTRRGFPGMFTSLDCMNWVWKNCPTAWR